MAVKTKKETKPVKKVKTKKTTKSKKDKFIYAVGRRKEATARVRLYPDKKGDIVVNEKPITEYFPGEALSGIYLTPLRTCNVIGKYLITIKVQGSGKMGQLGAVMHGMSRVLVKLNEKQYRPILKKKGLLTRDSRVKERRKVGTGGKARRGKQSPKR